MKCRLEENIEKINAPELPKEYFRNIVQPELDFLEMCSGISEDLLGKYDETNSG